jgi:hypothetical protein
MVEDQEKLPPLKDPEWKRPKIVTADEQGPDPTFMS